MSRLLLLAGASPNYLTEFLGQAPVLMMFAQEGVTDMVSLLIEFNSDVNLTNSQGCTALTLAAAKGHCEVSFSETFVSHQKSFSTILQYMFSCQVVKQLIAAGANLSHGDTAGQCPLVHAARNGHISVVTYLLACEWVVSKPSDVELCEAAQQALIAAAGQGHTEVSRMLSSYMGNHQLSKI